jgi:transcriptional regulator with XRE-family HTH domain
MERQAVDQTVMARTIAAEAPLPRVGDAIRRLRQARGLTLQALADAAGVSVGMLSQIERDRANPSLRLLTQIRVALDAPISALFDDAGATADDPPFVRRAGQRPMLDLGYLTKELLSPSARPSLQFMILHIPPHGDSGAHPLSYPAEKGGMLIEGELLLRVGNHEVLLGEGDSFLFDSCLPHGFRNPRDQPAKVLWIIGPVLGEQHV